MRRSAAPAPASAVASQPPDEPCPQPRIAVPLDELSWTPVRRTVAGERRRPSFVVRSDRHQRIAVNQDELLSVDIRLEAVVAEEVRPVVADIREDRMRRGDDLWVRPVGALSPIVPLLRADRQRVLDGRSRVVCAR